MDNEHFIKIPDTPMLLPFFFFFTTGGSSCIRSLYGFVPLVLVNLIGYVPHLSVLSKHQFSITFT